MNDTPVGQSSRPSAPGTAAPKTRRRNRIITSCLECRRRKLKCDKKYPCDHCHKANRDCVFLAPARDPAAQSRYNLLKDNIEQIEKELESGHDNAEDTQWITASQTAQPSTKSQGAPVHPRDEILEPTPLAVDAVAYEDDEDDILDDLGIQLGKMRVTERIGGSLRPLFSSEIADVMRKGAQDADVFANWQDSMTAEEFLAPGKLYLSPGAGLVFPALSMTSSLSLINFLPSRELADTLLHEYWLRVHPLARVVHRMSFERQYLQFWQAVSSGYEPKFSIQALVFAALFSAAVSMPEDLLRTRTGREKDELVKNLQTAVEYALSKANFLKTVKTDTICAFCMYLLVICRRDISRAHAVYVTMAIRLAMMAGLHKDGTNFGLSPVETHVRRLVWHQLSSLDLRTCQAVGPAQALIRFDEYDTKLPLNVDDADFEALIQPTKDAARFTDNTLNKLRKEISQFSSEMFLTKENLDKRHTALSAALQRIDEWFKKTEARYVPLLDEKIPVQDLTLKLLRMARSGFYIGLLHKYVVSAPKKMPQRLVDVVWHASLAHAEISRQIETDPRFELWSWYSGTFQNYHVALLLFAQVAFAPNRKDVDRAWRILEYVFELPPHLSGEQKLTLLALQARSRMAEYERRRRRRLPVELQQSLGITHFSQTQGPRPAAPGSGVEFLGLNPVSPPVSAGVYGQAVRSPLHGTEPRRMSQHRESTGSPASYFQGGTGYSSGTTPQQVPDTSSFNQVTTPTMLDFSSFPDLPEMDWDEIDRMFQMDITMDGMGTAATEPPRAGNNNNNHMSSPPVTKTDFDITALDEMTMPIHPGSAYSRPPPAAELDFDITALDEMALPSMSLIAPPTWARPIG